MDMENETIVKTIKLIIATPCYGGQCYVDYFISLMSSINYLKDEYNIECHPIFIKNDSLITRARNNLVAMFMADPTNTHLMFIDADIMWDARDIYQLLKDDKDVIGGIYPLKKYHWENLEKRTIEGILEAKDKYEHNKFVKEADYVRQNLMKYNVNYGEDVKIVDNLLKVKHLPTGFMMIKRRVFEHLFEVFADLKYSDDCSVLSKEENKYAYALFDGGVVDGRYLSEDWLFCQRWQAAGGEVYANIKVELTHIGQSYYQGRFLSSLRIE